VSGGEDNSREGARVEKNIVWKDGVEKGGGGIWIPLLPLMTTVLAMVVVCRRLRRAPTAPNRYFKSTRRVRTTLYRMDSKGKGWAAM